LLPYFPGKSQAGERSLYNLEGAAADTVRSLEME